MVDCQVGDFFKNPRPVKKTLEAGERSGSRTGPTGVRRRKFWTGQVFVLVQIWYGGLTPGIGSTTGWPSFTFVSWRDEWDVRGRRRWVWLR